MKIDLHMHSLYSDGSDDVEHIVKKSKELQLDLIALTDHNTLEGLADLKKYALIYQQNVLAGVELSTMYQYKEIHLLGYFPINSDLKDDDFAGLRYFIKQYQDIKRQQNEAIIFKLSRIFDDISIDDFYLSTASHNINRVHIAQYLVKKGHVADINEAFQKYIGYHCCCYVKKKAIPIKQGIKAIHQARGKAVIAHLGQYHLENLTEFIQQCIDDGVDGFECYHPFNDEKIVALIQKYQKEMLLTAGSDYHGSHKKNNVLGKTYSFSMSHQQKQLYDEIIERTYHDLMRL